MNNDRKRKKRRKIRRSVDRMIRYAIVFFIIYGILMAFFYRYLYDYEHSRSAYAVKAYTESFDEDYLAEVSVDFRTTLDTKLQSKEDSLEKMAQIILPSLSYSKDLSSESDDAVTYKLKAENQVFGSVTFTKENHVLSYDRYVVSQESFDFSWLAEEKTVSLPDGWTIYVDENPLSDSYITGTDGMYTLLESFYGDGNPYGLPVLKTYKISRVIDPAIVCMDPAGNSYDPDELDESLFLSEADETTETDVESFISAFLPFYVQCLSNANHNAEGNYLAIQPYILSGGNLDNRLYEAIAGQYWANSDGDTILSTTYHSVKDTGNGYLLVDVTYELETIGLQGAVQSESNNRILVQNTGDGFQVVDLESY